LSAAPAASQAALVTPSACTISGPLQQFAGDGNYYYDAGALSLSAGAPQQVQGCVNVAHPALRLNIAGADPGATVSVSALFNVGAATVAIPVGTISATPGLSPVLTINVINIPNGSTTVPVTLSVSAQGGNVSVANTWVDPWGG
jgi:hypothetical protein